MLRLVVGTLADQQFAGSEQLQELVDRVGFRKRGELRQQLAELFKCVGEESPKSRLSIRSGARSFERSTAVKEAIRLLFDTPKMYFCFREVVEQSILHVPSMLTWQIKRNDEWPVLRRKL